MVHAWFYQKIEFQTCRIFPTYINLSQTKSHLKPAKFPDKSRPRSIVAELLSSSEAIPAARIPVSSVSQCMFRRSSYIHLDFSLKAKKTM